jgi:lipopolysaccharide biosynthesis regulator YciM
MNMSRYSSSKIMVRPERMMEENKVVIQPPFTGEVVCRSCGFKARYKFYRCPQCDAEQK